MASKNQGVRWLIIQGMSREKLVDLIRRRDAVFCNEPLEDYSMNQLRDIASVVDLKLREERERKKQPIQTNENSPIQAE